MPENAAKRRILRELPAFAKSFQKSKRFKKGGSEIHYSGPVFSSSEVSAAVGSILDSAETGQFVAGKKVAEFESKLAQYVGTKYANAVNSGSSADLLAIASLKDRHLKAPIKQGDEVVTSALNFSTALNSIIQNGLKPVLVDSKESTYTMDAGMLEDAISDRTKCILAVHLFGNACNMKAVMGVAKKHGLFVIEDCCDSLGTTYMGKKVGSIGDMGTFSFYPAHQITVVEGGAVATSDLTLDYVLRSMRFWGKAVPCRLCGMDLAKQCPVGHDRDLPGMESYDPSFLFVTLGYNTKLIEMQGAIGVEQLKKLERFNRIRRENFVGVAKALRPFDNLLVLPRAEEGSDPAWYSIPLSVRPDAGFSRDEIVRFLKSSKVETRYLFGGNLLDHPAYEGLDTRVVGDIPVARSATRNSFFVGCYQGINARMREYIIDVLTKFLQKFN